jgi:hypothetical protein
LQRIAAIESDTQIREHAGKTERRLGRLPMLGDEVTGPDKLSTWQARDTDDHGPGPAVLADNTCGGVNAILGTFGRMRDPAIECRYGRNGRYPRTRIDNEPEFPK